MSERSLVQRPPSEVGFIESPGAIIARATEQANALMDVVEKRKLYAEIDGKKYLTAEAWETICAFNNASPITAWVIPIERDGVIIGFEARVDLWKNGELIGGAQMPCGLEEFPCRGKEGMAKEKAARSAAQTWALSKASRMKFSYVAVLAGFEPTPAEEMIEGQVIARAEASPTGHYCSTHKTVWFKRGRMRNYAHPIKGADGKDTGEWCNEPEREAQGEAQENTQREDSIEEASAEATKGRLATKAELIDNINKGFDVLEWDTERIDAFLSKYCGDAGLSSLTAVKLEKVLKDLSQIATALDTLQRAEEPKREELPY